MIGPVLACPGLSLPLLNQCVYAKDGATARPGVTVRDVLILLNPSRMHATDFIIYRRVGGT